MVRLDDDFDLRPVEFRLSPQRVNVIKFRRRLDAITKAQIFASLFFLKRRTFICWTRPGPTVK